MADPEIVKVATEVEVPTSTGTPLVFISHDSRDADLAEAFSKLIKSVSAGMIKTFRSSDKKGTEGIDFGEEWYKRLMAKLQTTSDVVCLFTERSLDRPWILFEAGVAKSKMTTPVVGIALGVPLTRVSTGPFYQFHNMDDSEADITKLVHQLARRIPGLELDSDVVKVQVASFKAKEAEILKKMSSLEGKKDAQETEESPISKLVEEMKALPLRVAERLGDIGDPFPRRRFRRMHPMMLDEMMMMTGDSSDPVGILMAASVIKDEVPWLYELALEVYRAVKSGDPHTIEVEMSRFHRFSEVMMHGPLMEEFGMGNKETHRFCMEFPHMLERMLQRALEKKPQTRRRRLTQQPEQQ